MVPLSFIHCSSIGCRILWHRNAERTIEEIKSVAERAMQRSRAMDLFLRILSLKTSGLRSIEIEAVTMIVITIQISGDVSPPSLNIAMLVERNYTKLGNISANILNSGLMTRFL